MLQHAQLANACVDSSDVFFPFRVVFIFLQEENAPATSHLSDGGVAAAPSTLPLPVSHSMSRLDESRFAPNASDSASKPDLTTDVELTSQEALWEQRPSQEQQWEPLVCFLCALRAYIYCAVCQ